MKKIINANAEEATGGFDLLYQIPKNKMKNHNQERHGFICVYNIYTEKNENEKEGGRG